MRQVHCTAELVQKQNDEGIWVDAVMARCPFCKRASSDFGTGQESLERSCLLLRDACRCRWASEVCFVGTMIREKPEPHWPRVKPVRKPRPKNRWKDFEIPGPVVKPAEVKPVRNPEHWTEHYY